MAPARAADAVPPLDSSASEPAAAPGEARALFALLGGTRAGAGRLVSPVLGGAAAIAVGRWELGLNLALELRISICTYPSRMGRAPPRALV